MKYDIIDALSIYAKNKSIKEMDDFIKLNKLDINGNYVKFTRNLGNLSPDEMALELIMDGGHDEYCCVADICIEIAAKLDSYELMDYLIENSIMPGTMSQYLDTYKGIANICVDYPDMALYYLEHRDFATQQDIRNCFFEVIREDRFSKLSKKVFEVFKKKIVGKHNGWNVYGVSFFSSIIEPIIVSPINWNNKQVAKDLLENIEIMRVPNEWYEVLDAMYEVPSGTFNWDLMKEFYRYRTSGDITDRISKLLNTNSLCSEFLIKESNPWDIRCYSIGLPWSN